MTFVPKEVKAKETVEKVTRFTLMKQGDRGQNVEELQIMLNLVNKTQLVVDGDFGAHYGVSVIHRPWRLDACVDDPLKVVDDGEGARVLAGVHPLGVACGVAEDGEDVIDAVVDDTDALDDGELKLGDVSC